MGPFDLAGGKSATLKATIHPKSNEPLILPSSLNEFDLSFKPTVFQDASSFLSRPLRSPHFVIVQPNQNSFPAERFSSQFPGFCNISA
jgi:hypothetical protein